MHGQRRQGDMGKDFGLARVHLIETALGEGRGDHLGHELLDERGEMSAVLRHLPGRRPTGPSRMAPQRQAACGEPALVSGATASGAETRWLEPATGCNGQTVGTDTNRVCI